MDHEKAAINGLDLAQDAAMETTSRLIAALVNEDLVHITNEGPQEQNDIHKLTLEQPNGLRSSSARIEISLRPDTGYSLVLLAEPEEHRVITPDLNPADIVGPVVIEDTVGSDVLRRLEYRPGKVFDVVAPWICSDQDVAARLRAELEDSADNQERWFQFERSQPPPKLDSPLIVWEQRCIKGHPTHPMHRSFHADPPLDPGIDTIEEFLDAKVIIVSVPRDRVHLDGPFEESIAPLLSRVGIDTAAIPADRALLPCFAAQLPAIHQYFGTDAIRVGSSELRGMRQMSMRTLSIPDFPLHLKMALSYTVTSARRTMTPWTTRMCIEVSQLLSDIADPELLWICRKRAAACSADADFEAAKHLSAMLREDPEPRACALGQCLVVPAVLFESPGKDRLARAVDLFHLRDAPLEARREWFRNYTSLYLRAVLPLLLTHGICLEAHMQNLLARFDVATGALRGFVYRDMGGLRMHVPTLRARDVHIRSADLVPGAVTLTDDLDAVWANFYHNLESHLGGALRGLGLAWGNCGGGGGDRGGWGIVREELEAALRGRGGGRAWCPDPDSRAAELWGFMVRPVVKRKAFLRMKIAGIYRGRVYSYRPNPLAVQDNGDD